MRLNVKAFALTSGILWGVGLFALTWFLIAFGESVGERTWLGKCYRGYTVSALGSLIGLVWAFFDGLICGAVFAWLYNRLASIATRHE